MSFTVFIAADTGNTVSEVAKVEQGLGAATAAADTTTAALGKTGQAGAVAGAAVAEGAQQAASGLAAVGAAASSSAGALDRSNQSVRGNVDALSNLIKVSQSVAAATETVVAASQRLEAGVGTGVGGKLTEAARQMVDAVAREAEILERIRAPMRRYNEDMAALESLYNRNKISAAEYGAEVDKLIKKQGLMQGPVQQLKAQAAPPAAKVLSDDQFANTATALNRTGAAGTAAGSQIAAGSKKAADAQKQAEQAAKGHGDALSNLIHMAEAYLAIHQLEGLIDSYIEMSNKLRTVSTDQANLNALTEETYRIAQVSRTSWESVASTYQRLSTVTKGLGLSQREVLDLTEEMAMAAKVGGATNREAGQAMSEFTHAFATGTMQGREFPVLMRDVPSLMKELQMASGKTGAEFAEMGKHGKITGALLVDWFGKAKDTIADKFGKTIPTISEGFQLISNAASKFFGATALGTGVVGGLGNAMKFVANNLETFGKVLIGVGEAVVGLYVIEKVIVLLDKLRLVMLANPLTAFLIIVTSAVMLLRQFGDEIETGAKVMTPYGEIAATVGDRLNGIWEALKKLGAQIFDFVENAWKALTAAFSGGVDTSGFDLSLRNVLTFIASFVDAAIGLFKYMNDTIITVFGGIPTIIAEVFVDMGRMIARMIGAVVNVIIDGINKLIEAKNKIASLLPGGSDPAQVANDPRRQQAAVDWSTEMNKKYGMGQYAAPDQSSATSAASLQAAQAAGLHPKKWSTREDDYRYAIDPSEAPGGAGGTHAANKLDPVDFDFKNPYAGATTDFAQKFKDDWEKDINGTNFAKDLVSKFMDDVDKGTAAHATDRRAAMDRDVGVASDAHNKKDPALADEKAEKALKRYENQLRAIEEATNPVVEAQEKLAHAQAFLTDAVRNHGLPQERANKDMEDYRRKLEDQLHPFDAWIRKQGEAHDALRSTSEETDRAAKLTALLEEQKKKGDPLDDMRIAQAQRIIEIEQRHAEQMRAEQGFMAQYNGAQLKYATDLRALGDLLEHGRINAEQYADAMNKVREAYLSAGPAARTAGAGVERAQIKQTQTLQDPGAAAEKAVTEANAAATQYAVTLVALNSEQVKSALTADQLARAIDVNRAAFLAADSAGKTFGGGMEQAWLKMKTDAESFGQTVANTVVGDIDKLNEALITAANSGAVAWQQLIGTILSGLEQIILKQLEVAAANEIISAFTGGGGDAGATLADIAKSAVGFATGGSYVVGGSGGTDSHLQMFRATPGERVTITPPGVYAPAANDATAGPEPAHYAPTPVTVNIAPTMVRISAPPAAPPPVPAAPRLATPPGPPVVPSPRPPAAPVVNVHAPAAPTAPDVHVAAAAAPRAAFAPAVPPTVSRLMVSTLVVPPSPFVVPGAEPGRDRAASSRPPPITTPAAYPTPKRSEKAEPAPPPVVVPAPIVEIHNHYNESVAHAAMQSPKGRQIYMNIQRASGGSSSTK